MIALDFLLLCFFSSYIYLLSIKLDYTATTAQEEGVTTILQITTAKSTTVKTTAVGWGDWSPWSKCSRSCDSGI